MRLLTINLITKIKKRAPHNFEVFLKLLTLQIIKTPIKSQIILNDTILQILTKKVKDKTPASLLILIKYFIF